MSNIGFHFVDNIYTQAEINNHFDLLQRSKPNYINVLGGMQHKEALGFAKDVRKFMPSIQVIFRHYKDGSDDGMHTRLEAKDWIERIAKQYLGYDLIILTDNESVSDNLTYYSDWHSTALFEAQKLGLKLAVGRFATGNPDDGSKFRNQYKDLDSMFHALAVTQAGIFSPNEYFEKINGGIGSIGRYKYALPYYYKYTDKPLKIVIGEYGYSHNYRAHDGYKSVNLNVDIYANELFRHFMHTYHSDNVDACLYSIGKWPLGNDTFGATPELIDLIVSFNKNLLELTTPENPPDNHDTEEISKVDLSKELLISIKEQIEEYLSNK